MLTQLRIIGAFAAKDLRVAWSYRFGFVMSHITPIYTVVLFYFISRVVGNSELVGGPDGYFRFVVVGIVLGDILRSAADTAAAGARRDQVEGTLENLMAEPVPLITIGLGWVAFPLADSFLRGAVTVLLAWPLGLDAGSINLPALFVALALSSVVFSAFGLIGAALVVAFQQGAGIIGLFLGLLALLSGALFPVSVLPQPLEWLSQASPMLYALDSTRGAALDGLDLSQISTELAVLAGFAVVLAPLSTYALAYASRFARQRGRLSAF